MRLATRIALAFTTTCLAATLTSAALLTAAFERYSRDAYYRTKVEELVAAAALVDGDYHRGVLSEGSLGEPDFARLRRALGGILASDPFATYLYTLNLAPDGSLVYAVDAATSEADTLWLETEEFALEVWRGPVGSLRVRYADEERRLPFDIEAAGRRLRLEESRDGSSSLLLVAGRELVRWPPTDGPPSAGGRPFGPGERKGAFSVEAEGTPIEGFATFSERGQPLSYPGDPCLEAPEVAERLKGWLVSGSSGYEESADSSIYGSSRSVYASIRDAEGRPAGLLVLDLYATARRGLFASLLGPGLLAGLACVALGALMALRASRVYAKPLRELAWAVEGLAEGRSHGPLPVARKDELGELARSFKAMVEALAERDAERERLHEESLRSALVDPTTGLPNRRAFLEESATVVALLERLGSGRSLALLYLDLDNFKNVNDGYGHGAGDELLHAVGARIKEAIRDADLAFRIGGDEFVILLTSLRREDDVVMVLDKLRGAIAAPMPIQGRDFLVTASCGVALYPRDGTSSEELLRVADTALYEAKRSRDTYAFFTPELGERVRRRTELVELLKAEPAFSEFRLVLQPIVDRGGRPRSFEALARWRKPDGREVPPADFIPIIEEAGLIGAFGSWCLGAAARAAKALAAGAAGPGGGPAPRVAVNLSVIQLLDGGQMDEIAARSASGELGPDRIYFEVTESCFAREKEVEPAVRRLAALGYKISLDDFGTGYSSLGRLGSLPFDAFKVDRSLLFAGGDARSRDAILGGIRSLGAGYGVDMVVEGVEDAETVERLVALGFGLFQGYYFSRPLEIEAAARYARELGGEAYY